MAKLRPPLPFDPDETPSSWAVRLAAFHTDGTLRSFLQDVEVPLVPFLTGDRDPIVRLCDLVGQDPEPVLRNAVTYTGKRGRVLNGQAFDAEMIARSLRFCRQCLIEDLTHDIRKSTMPRHRLLWTLEPIRTCFRHDVVLEIRPRDRSVASYIDLGCLLPMTGEANNSSVVAPVIMHPTALERYIAGRVVSSPGPEWLDGQPLDHAWRGTEMLGGVLLNGPESQSRDMSPSDWQRAAEAGWAATSRGEAGIAAAINDLVKRDCRKTRKNALRPRMVLGMFHDWLKTQNRCNISTTFRDVVVDSLVEHYTFVPVATVLGRTVDRPRYSTVYSFTNRRSQKIDRFKEVLCNRGLLRESQLDIRSELQIVEYEPAAAVYAALSRIVSVASAGFQLRTSPTMIDALLRSGFLAHAPSALTGLEPSCLDGMDIASLMDLIARLPKVTQTSRAAILPYEACEASGKTLDRVLSVALSNRRRSTVRFGGPSDMGGVLVAVDDLDLIAASDEVGMTGEVAFRMLGLPYQNDGSFLNWSEMLFPFKSQAESSRSWFFSAEISSFRETFVLDERLPTEHGVSAVQVGKVIEFAGVKPAIDPGRFGATLYRRSDLEGLRFW